MNVVTTDDMSSDPSRQKCNMSNNIQELRIKDMIKRDRVIYIDGTDHHRVYLLLNDLMYHLSKHYDVGLAYSPYDHCVNEWRSFIPASCLYTDEESTLSALKRMIEKMKQLQNRGIRKHAFVILDRFFRTNNKKLFGNPTIRNLFMNGRHYDILFIVTGPCASANIMPPYLRANVDYVMTTYDCLVDDHHGVRRNFFGMLHDQQTFCSVVRHIEKQDAWLVLDAVYRGSQVENMLFWYVPRAHHPRFLLGNRDVWKLHYLTHVHRQPVNSGNVDSLGSQIRRLGPLQIVPRQSRSGNPNQTFR